MRDFVVQYAASDRIDFCPPLAGSSVTPFVDHQRDQRSLSDLLDSVSADDGEQFWIELGGEG